MLFAWKKMEELTIKFNRTNKKGKFE